MEMKCRDCDLVMQKVSPKTGDCFFLPEFRASDKNVLMTTGYGVDLFVCPSCGRIEFKVYNSQQ